MTDLASPSDNSDVKNNGASDPSEEDAAAFAAKVSEFRGHRAMKVWMLVMLSMGYRPTATVRKKSLQQRDFANEFLRRIRFIRGNLTIHKTSAPPSVLYFNSHPSSELLPDTQEKYVDVVTALQALRGQFGSLPPPVDELEPAAADLPIPYDWHDGATEADDAETVESKSGANRVEGNASKFIRALLELHHGLPERATLSRSVKDIMTEFEKAGIESGLGEHAIKTQLEGAIRAVKK